MLEVIGFKKMEFSPDNQTTIKGFKVFCTDEKEEGEDKALVGIACDSFFISADKAEKLNYEPKLGQQVELYYNKYGKIDRIDVA